MRTRLVTTAALILCLSSRGQAERFDLVIGVDPGRYPGTARTVVPLPGPGVPGSFSDGDRLAGTPDVGGPVVYQGFGTPLFDPNQFGSMSFVFKRGSVPLGPAGQLPWMGIDFLGGPLLDLDGEPDNGSRSLIPVLGRTPVPIPGTTSHVELVFDVEGGVVRLMWLDITGTSEGGPNVQPEIATSINVLAGTGPDAAPGSPINPSVDTRRGQLTPFAGTDGTLSGVWHIDDLGLEIWQDTIDPNSATASVLGTFQFLSRLRGWWVQRDPLSGQFPALTGQGLGSTLWPRVDTSMARLVFNTANGLAGGTATITTGPPADIYTAPGNGGLALSDYDADLGAYLDQVVVPRIHAESASFVYLEGSGAGINNSGDPIFGDRVGYDIVIIAQAAPPRLVAVDMDSDGDVDLNDFARFQACFNGAGRPAGRSDCQGADTDFDRDVDVNDFAVFQACFNGAGRPPACG